MRTILAAAFAACLMSAPAMAAEMVTAVFTTPDGGVTTGLYSGVVTLTVSGVGQSDGAYYNDAFYIYTNGPPYNQSYYDLSLKTSTLFGSNAGDSVNNYIVGAIPAYNPSHIYTFAVDTGVSVPTALHFGVTDDIFSDNSGAYSITIGATTGASVPEPATWALTIAGLFGMGAVLRRRRPRAAVAG